MTTCNGSAGCRWHERDASPSVAFPHAPFPLAATRRHSFRHACRCRVLRATMHDGGVLRFYSTLPPRINSTFPTDVRPATPADGSWRTLPRICPYAFPTSPADGCPYSIVPTRDPPPSRAGYPPPLRRSSSRTRFSLPTTHTFGLPFAPRLLRCCDILV